MDTRAVPHVDAAIATRHQRFVGLEQTKRLPRLAIIVPWRTIFAKLSERYTADALAHAGMATLYRTGRTAGMAVHCDRLAQAARRAAAEAKEASSQHASMK